MQTISLPFHVIQLRIGNHPAIVSTPIVDHNVLWINIDAKMLAGKFANAFQSKVLDQGEYSSLLDYSVTGPFEKRSVQLKFKAPKRQISYRQLYLTFDYFVKPHEKGFWCIVPSLGIEAFAEEEEKIEETVGEAIRLDFIRNDRLSLLQDVISTIWYQEAELIADELQLKTYSPSEIVRLKERQKEDLLPSVAHQLAINRRMLWGYQKELQQLTQILKGKYNNNVLLVGHSGVGKSTLVWELVRQKRARGVRQNIWETTASILIKELTGNMGWQENLANLCKELSNKGDILFLRNLLELFEVGQYQGNTVSMADFLRDYLANGTITLIAECTDEEYARIEARSPNYLSLFQVIRVTPPESAAALEDIILQKVLSIAQTQQVKIEQEAVKETIRLNRRYTPYSGFPGKPIRFLESILINNQDSDGKRIDRSSVIQSFCEETGMPPFMVDPAIPMPIDKVKAFFLQHIFGQNHAVDTISDILASVKTALLRQGKPIASMLFVGPTGVGKTEMAKVLADFMFGSRRKMIRFDMSEFSTPYAVARLTGTSYFSDGLLTAAVRREPFCVLLFDELEKAHPLFNDLLLQMLGEGRLTDSQGKVVNFCSTIIIMTSNIGAKKLQSNSIGWSDSVDNEEVASHFVGEVRKFFKPEIFNRIDQIVPFHSLSQDVVRFVVQREIELLKRREGILHRNIDLHLSETLLDYLGHKGYDPKYGARALQRTLREELVIPLSYQLNTYNFDDKLVVHIDIKKGQIDIAIVADPLKLELMLEELTHNEYMEYASSLRKNIFKLYGGRFYIRLLSELDLLNQEKKRKPKRFWKDEHKSALYSNLLALKEDFRKHREVIEDYELEMALTTMGHQTIDTKLYQLLEKWEKDYFQLKLKLFEQLEPKQKQIEVHIYGRELQRMLKIYKQLCEEKNYDFRVKTIWYRDSLYNETVTTVDDDGNSHQKAGKVYMKRPFDFEDADRWKVEKDGDIIVGLILQIEGTAANLFFNEEEGHHQLELKDNRKVRYWIQTNVQPFLPSDGIHRNNFFQTLQRPRRIIGLETLEDNVYKLPKRELKPKQRIPFLIKLMDKSFKNKLDALLF